MITQEEWERIKKSYEFVFAGYSTRVDGNNDKYSVYKVGSNVIRIDVKIKE